jgi:hypothetical protein
MGGLPPVGTAAYAWQNVKILGGGFVPGIVFSPVEDGLAYARTDVGGAYRWEGASGRWTPITDWISHDQQNLLGPESIAADPVDANKVYIAAGMYVGAGAGAILRSSDKGDTWQVSRVSFAMGSNHDGRSMGERLVIDPNLTSVLYFGSRSQGLWKSTDSAVSFQVVPGFTASLDPTFMGISFVLFDPRSGSAGHASTTLYAGMAGADPHVYVSTDSGATWNTLAGEPAGLVASHGALDADGMLYITYGNGPGPNNVTNGAVFKYDTQTQTFTDITPAAPQMAGAPELDGGAPVTFGYGGLSLDAQHSGTLVVSTIDRWSTGDDIYRSTDAGAHWTALAPLADHAVAGAEWLYFGGTNLSANGWMGDVDIDPFHPEHVFYVTGQGIWGSDDLTAADSGLATHFTFRNEGLEETVALGLVSPPAGPALFSALGDVGGFRHDDLSVSPVAGMYNTPRFSTTTSIDFAEANPNVMVRVGAGSRRNGRGAYSSDAGLSWTRFATEPTGGNGQGSVAVSADGSAIVWSALPATVLPAFSTDQGGTWTASAGLVGGVKVAADRVNPNKFYAFNAAAGVVYASTTAGAQFTPSTTSLTVSDGGSLVTVPGREGDVWVTTNGAALYHSTDSGVTFSAVRGVPRSYGVGFGKAAPGADYPALYLAGTIGAQTGLFRSDDGAASFVRIDDPEHQFGWVSVIIGDPRTYGRVYLGNSGRGVIYGDPAE